MRNHNAVRNYAEKVRLPYREAVIKAIREGGSVPEGAKIIGMHRASLYDFIKKHKIAVEVTNTRVIGVASEKESVS
jgi:molybdenum-dependent DNA-binding transcriptional regulator ModE